MSEPNGTGGRVDLASLAAKAAPTTIKSAAVRAGSDNPFLKAVRESHDQDRAERDSGWREVEVPVSMLDEMITTMRALSTWFGEVGEPIGVHMRIEYMPDPSKDGSDASHWDEVGPSRFGDIPREPGDAIALFKFTGRDRMKRGRRRQPSPQQAAAGHVDVEAKEDEETELQPA